MTTMEARQTYSGWLLSSARGDLRERGLAHHFDEGGNSACHLWTRTTFDQPAPPGVDRCETCAELVARRA